MNEFSSDVILAQNAELSRYSLNLSIEDMVILEVEYTVEGNGKRSVLSDGLFYPRATLFKFNGNWTLGTAEGFPIPDTKELASLFGGINK